MDNGYNVRNELWVIALLLKKPGITRKEVERLIPRLLSKIGHNHSKTVSDLISYIDYLIRIGVVTDDNGRLYLRQDKLSSFLMKHVRQIANSDIINGLFSESIHQERIIADNRMDSI